MTIRITQMETDTKLKMTFLVEGSLDFAGAEILVNVCRGALKQTEEVIIDISGLNFLDETGAGMLRWLQGQPDISLSGCDPRHDASG